MCGIYAYIGKNRDAASTVFKGLKQLEYRGYDSWGLSYGNDGNLLKTHKRTGKIGNSSIEKKTRSDIAIGHTRWATHGGVTVENAHPHLDCSKNIALVHNGIIDNHQELKKDLKKRGHSFTSETDTEVALHLIEEEIKDTTFSQAVMRAFQKLEGLNALVAIHQPTHTIVAVKNGSPLVIGLGEKEFFIASDPIAIRPYTDRVVYLKDEHVAVIQQSHLTFFEAKTGKKKEFVPEKIEWAPQAAAKGDEPHFMIKEVKEQPAILKSFAKNSQKSIKNLASVINSKNKVLLTGCGTAGHAALVGKYLLHQAGIAVDAIEGSELEWFIPDNESTYPIFISQSGETIDIVQPAIAIKERGIPFAALVNRLGSTLERMTKDKVLLSAGPEISVVSTKVFTTKVAALLLLSAELKGEYQKMAKELEILSTQVATLTTNDYRKKHIQPVVEFLKTKEHIFTLGRGLSYPVAKEAALKIKEVAYIHTEGFAGGELKHGVIALIEEGTPVIVFAPMDETYPDIISNATEVASRGATIIGISKKPNEVFDYHIPVKDTGLSTAISHSIIGQLIGYHLAVDLKLDPDKPRNLAKSVTVK